MDFQKIIFTMQDWRPIELEIVHPQLEFILSTKMDAMASHLTAYFCICFYMYLMLWLHDVLTHYHNHATECDEKDVSKHVQHFSH